MPETGSETGSAAPAAAAAKPVNLPYPSIGTLFKGRDDLLAALNAGFRAAPDRPQALAARHAIHGLGGIGKTRAAVEYAWRHADHYSALLFVSLQSPSDLTTKLAALCDLFGIARGVIEEPERARAALAWLADPAHAGWLLIADNLDTPEIAAVVERTLGTLPGGHLLLTGRVHDWPADIRPLRLDVLDPESARAFLLERTQDRRRTAPDDPEQAARLAELLGRLALALEQAAAFVRRFGLGLADYRARWEAADRRVREWHDPRTMQYDRPIATAWQTTVDALPPQARALLDLLAWLAPEPLPAFLFDRRAAPLGCAHLLEGASDPREILRTFSGDPEADPEEALALLRDVSLLQPAGDDVEFASVGQVHRVLQLVTRERLEGEARTAALGAALGLVNAAAVGDPGDVRTWPLWEPLETHCLVVTGHRESAGIGEPTARLLNELGLLLKTKAQHAEAEPLDRRSLAIYETIHGPEHPEVAIGLSNLAALLYDTNRLADAEPLMRRALAIDEASLGAEHPRVAVRLNNLAQLFKDTNRLVEAEPLMCRALAIDEAILGAEHPSVAIRLNNLAQLLQDTERLTEAEPLMRRALAIDEASFGAEHPNVARDLNNLARLLLGTDRLVEAEPLMRRALAIDEASLGAEHPRVAVHLSNLAQLLKDTDRLVEAELFMHRALAIDEASLGAEHPNLAIQLNNLAQLLQATDRPAEAEPLMARAVSILLRSAAGTGHPHPELRKFVVNFWALLAAQAVPEAERSARLASLAAEAGLAPGDLARLLADPADSPQTQPPGLAARLRRALARLWPRRPAG